MISIITSLYKSEKHLPSFLNNAKELHSALQKNKVAFEHILVANDISAEEESHINASGLILTTLKVPRETLYASWNRGVREAHGEYITFWSVDDTRTADSIIKGAEVLAKGYDATYFPYIYKRYTYILGIKLLVMRKKVDQIEYHRDLFRKGMYAGPHFMVTKNIFTSNEVFDETFKIAGDFDWWARLAKNDARIIKTPVVSGVFSNDGKTLSGSKNILQSSENNRVVEKYSP